MTLEIFLDLPPNDTEDHQYLLQLFDEGENIKPIEAKTSTNPKVENGNLFFFNKLEYKAQQKTARSIHTFPILKFKFKILFKSAFEKIIKTPINETIKPRSWNKLNFSTPSIEDKKRTKTGIIEIISIVSIAWV